MGDRISLDWEGRSVEYAKREYNIRPEGPCWVAGAEGVGGPRKSSTISVRRSFCGSDNARHGAWSRDFLCCRLYKLGKCIEESRETQSPLRLINLL